MKFQVVPCELSDANEFVSRHHRHHPPVVGHKFSLAVVDQSQTIRGVVVVGRPVARMSDDGLTLEVTRCCTDGAGNAASALYGAARRASFALGYRRLITYTLQTEPGTSLRAAGWKVVGEVRGRSWSVPSRPRVDKSQFQKQDKFRWEVSA